MKQSLRSGQRSLAEVLDEAERDDVVAHTKVVEVLKALPRIGAVRAEQVMSRLDIAPNRRLRGLGRHQIAALVAEFEPRGARSADSEGSANADRPAGTGRHAASDHR